MYDELISSLRMHHCDAKEDDTQEVCEECAYDVIIADKSVPSGFASVCVCGLMNRAADAIEEMQRCIDGIDADNDSLCQQIEELQGQLYLMKKTAEWLSEKVPKWIPVTERLPKEKINPYTNDFEPIICATNFGDVRVYKYGTPIGWNEPHFWNGAGIMDYYVTHWMNLPEPPKGDE